MTTRHPSSGRSAAAVPMMPSVTTREVFWRKGVTMYDHAIFTRYSLSFLSLWSVLIGLMGTNRFTDGFVWMAVLYMPVHLFVHLKETYRLRWFSAGWRTFALLFAGSLVALLFLLLILFISLN